jgi:sugar/nucleoside kinase (ribokinase family)
MACLLQMTAPVVDLIYRVRAVPRPGQEAIVTGFCIRPGGGFNAMVAARRAGIPVRLGGSLGQGPFARIVADALVEQGIEQGRPALAGVDQGCCVVMLEPDGERSFVAAPGAEGRIAPMDLQAIAMDRGDWVMLSGYTLHYEQACRAVSEWVATLPASVKLIFDPSPVVAELPAGLLRPVLSRADWVSANSQEAAVLSGHGDALLAAQSLSQGRAGAIVRRGAAGCILSCNGRDHVLSGHEVDAIDTNGAGDTHIGSFVAEMILSRDPLRAARYANIAAALSTTREGPATAPDRAQVLAIL